MLVVLAVVGLLRVMLSAFSTVVSVVVSIVPPSVGPVVPFMVVGLSVSSIDNELGGTVSSKFDPGEGGIDLGLFVGFPTRFGRGSFVRRCC